MAEISEDSTYRISGLYVTPNWNGNQDRVAMSCGIGATIKVLRKVGVVIAADPGATMARSWNMTARNTILRTAAKVYLYARVERNGANGMYIWSANIYDVEGYVNKAEDVHATNNEQYYYIRVGSLETDRVKYTIDFGDYGLNEDGEEPTAPSYNWDDLMKFDPVNGVIVFLYNLASVAFNSIILLGRELSYVLRGDDIKKDKNGNYITTEHEESDNAVVTGGFLKAWLGKISGNFLRKDKDDETAHQLTMQKAVVRSAIETQGYNGKDSIDGTGAAMWEVDERGEKIGHVVTDYLAVRRAATFRNLSIIEVNHMGGELIISAADCDIAYVDPLDADGNLCSPADAVRFRCYFEKEANGRVVYNEWKRNDQAYCRRFNVAEKSEVDGSFYWRMVLDVHNATENETFHWIDLSNILDDEVPQVALDSNTPKADDKIVVFGHQCHRDNPGEHFYDRTCAQMYSTVGINAPSRDYYYGIGTLTDEDGNITPFALPSSSMEGVGRNDKDGVYWHVGDNKHYMNYSTEKGLDIRTSSMTVIADGKDVSVGEALGDNFQFITSSDKAPTENGEVAKWIHHADIDPSDGWGIEECDEHVGDYLITLDGFTYEFVRDDSGSVVSHGWQISSDEYLLNAQKDANSALKNLSDMADDGVITPQEKLVLRSELERLTNDVNAVNNDAVSANISSSAVIRNMNEWFLVFRTITEVGILANMKDTTSLSNLTVYLSTSNSIPIVSTLGRPDTTVSLSPVGRRHDFRQCYSNVYMRLSLARNEVNGSIMNNVNDILAGDIDINKQVMNAVEDLGRTVNGYGGTITSLQDEVLLLANNVVYTDPDSGKTWDLLKGMIATDNFSTLFASAIDENGNIVTQADITAFVKKDKDGKLESGVSISADSIDFDAKNITAFTENFQLQSEQLKIYNENGREYFEIYTDNFTVDKQGNAMFKGDVHAQLYYEDVKTYTALSAKINLGTARYPLGTIIRLMPSSADDKEFVMPLASEHKGLRLRILAFPEKTSGPSGIEKDKEFMVKLSIRNFNPDGFNKFSFAVIYMMARLSDSDELEYYRGDSLGAKLELISDGTDWILVEAKNVVTRGT